MLVCGVCVCDLTTVEGENIRILRVQWSGNNPSSLVGKFQASKRPCLKARWNVLEECQPRLSSGFHGWAHMGTDTHTKCLEEVRLRLLLVTLPSFQTVPELGVPQLPRMPRLSLSVQLLK